MKNLVLGGIALYLASTIGAYTYFKKPSEQIQLVRPSESDRIATFDRIAHSYDDEVGIHEKISSIMKLRKQLIANAQGRVLEIAAGTGRNIELYKPECCTEADSRQLPYPDASFDTAVDTFGLCSFEDPVSSLKELSRVVKPDGKILLLEHGRSKHGWLSSFLDSREKQHVAKYGCYWNRDIESIVNQAGLKIVHKEPHHLGTTMMIVAERNNEMKPSNI